MTWTQGIASLRSGYSTGIHSSKSFPLGVKLFVKSVRKWFSKSVYTATRYMYRLKGKASRCGIWPHISTYVIALTHITIMQTNSNSQCKMNHLIRDLVCSVLNSHYIRAFLDYWSKKIVKGKIEETVRMFYNCFLYTLITTSKHADNRIPVLL